MLVSFAAIDVEAANTVTSTGFGRYLAFALRFANYVAVTIMMLYIGNASRGSVATAPGDRLDGRPGHCRGRSSARWRWRSRTSAFSSPASLLLPDSLAESKGEIKLAQVQPVLGETSPRPSAPFAFTNAWGNNVSLLLVWLVAGWGCWAPAGGAWRPGSCSRWRWSRSSTRSTGGCGSGWASVSSWWRSDWRHAGVPGCWRGSSGCSSSVAAGFAHVTARHHGRTSGSTPGTATRCGARSPSDAVAGAATSPVIGFGSTRQTIGSDASIAIGPSGECPKCGGRDIGSTGQLWLLLIAQGFLGAVLYLGFFLRSLWAYRTDHSVLGIAGTAVVLLEMFYSLFYTALTMPLATAFVSIGLLWRNQQLRKAAGVPR